MAEAPVAVLIGGTDPSVRVGGHETLVLAHAEAAVRAGFETHVFFVATTREPPSFGSAWTPHPLRSPVRPVRTLMARVHAPYMSAPIERFILGTRRPVVLHAFGSWACVAATVAQRLRRCGRALAPIASAYTLLAHEIPAKVSGVSRDHGFRARLPSLAETAWIRAVASRGERGALAAMSLVLVNYASVETLLRAHGVTGVPIVRVPYASLTAFHEADAPAQAPAPLAALQPADAPLVVAVSRHDPRKGVDRLVRALALLRTDGIPFRACLTGTGHLLSAHRALAERLGLSSCTALPGLVADPLAYLRAADVFVLPSLEEGSGSVSLLEAMQAGCAIVASCVDGIPEDIVDGVNGVLVPPDDPRALCDALARLLADAATRARLGRAARTTFERRFSSNALIAAIRDVYANVAC